jgi:hypothetical protein
VILVCEQCNGSGECKPGIRCPCREEDDEAMQRRSQMTVTPKLEAEPVERRIVGKPSSPPQYRS